MRVKKRHRYQRRKLSQRRSHRFHKKKLKLPMKSLHLSKQPTPHPIPLAKKNL